MNMSISKIVIKYHSLKMLLTLDLNRLIMVLIKKYGNDININIIVMNNEERAISSDITNGITLINERFWILETYKNGDIIRKKEIEQKIISEGQK